MSLPQYLLELPAPLFGRTPLRAYVKLQIQDLPDISEEMLWQVEALLMLPFSPLGGSSNLCFIQSDEILPEFRTSFHQLHLLDALYASSLAIDATELDATTLPVLSDPDTFWKLSACGQHLRGLHSLSFESFHVTTPFMSSPHSTKNIEPVASRFPYFQENSEGDTGTIRINSHQYFAEVPKAAWELRIHGQQPAMEALVLLQGPEIQPEQVLAYQKCLYALMQSLEPMKTIAGVL